MKITQLTHPGQLTKSNSCSLTHPTQLTQHSATIPAHPNQLTQLNSLKSTQQIYLIQTNSIKLNWTKLNSNQPNPTQPNPTQPNLAQANLTQPFPTQPNPTKIKIKILLSLTNQSISELWLSWAELVFFLQKIKISEENFDGHDPYQIKKQTTNFNMEFWMYTNEQTQ